MGETVKPGQLPETLRIEVEKLLLTRDASGKHAVSWATIPVPLTHLEFEIVRHLAQHAGTNCRYKDMPGFRSVPLMRNNITNIRAKFVDTDPNFDALQAKASWGYRLGTLKKPPDSSPAAEGKIQCGMLDAYPAIAEVFWNDRHVKLSVWECSVVLLLVKNVGRYIPKRTIHPGNVRARINRIRNAFKDIDPQFKHIQCRYKSGYRWKPQDA